MDPFLSDRHAPWHPVDLSLFPLRPPPRRPSIITRSLTLARYATTPVYTEVQDLSHSARISIFDPKIHLAIYGSPLKRSIYLSKKEVRYSKEHVV